MKKIISAVLAAIFVLSFSACGAGGSENSGASSDAEQPAVGSALELLQTVWNSYADDEKFSVIGGDASEENMTTDAPGNLTLRTRPRWIQCSAFRRERPIKSTTRPRSCT